MTAPATARRGPRLSVRARLVATYVLLVVAVAGVTLFVLERSLASDLAGSLDARLRAQATAVAGWLQTSRHPERLAPRFGALVAARVTIVGADGLVAGDSAAPGEIGRPIGQAPEVAAARRGAFGQATRVLDGDGVEQYLVAVAGGDGSVVRLAVPTDEVEATRAAMRDRLLLGFALAVVAALVFGLLAVRSVTRPLAAMTVTAEQLARGDYKVPPPSDARDELGLLSRTLAALAGEVEKRVGELTAQRDLLSAVIGGLVEGVIVVDRGGAIALANPAARALIGEGALPAEIAAVIAAIARDDDVASEAEVVVRGRVVRASARPLGDDGAIAVLYDLTRLRALEDLRREFLANATHELRTPVTAIAGYAETLLGGDVDAATAREFLTVIGRNTARIARLVDDLLVLERLDARAEIVSERGPVEVGAVIADAVATARAAVPEAAITIEVAGAPVALGTRDGLDHVVQNLVDNAVRHGGGAVTVRARRDGGRVIVEVADRGPGIAPAEQERVFERFYRVGGGRKSGGSGLGLAIVKRWVEAMGGAIRIESVVGEGATFVVELEAGETAAR
ncbi:MAG: HAMP domain-containing protein [Deltaproteobacteria bacterium]|nr:HAMP domain-containing protein [Deltaproteobacteria bacterium]